MSVLDTMTAYQHYYDLTVPACASGAAVSVTLGNLTTTPGLKSWGYVRDDLKDLRVAYFNGSTWADIPRNVTSEVVSFAAQATHGSQTVGTYAIYFGNAGESSTPTDFTHALTFDINDAFSNSSFDTTNFWSRVEGSGAVTETTSLSVTSSSANDLAVFGRKGALDSTFTMVVRARITGTTNDASVPNLSVLQSSSDISAWTNWSNTVVNAAVRIKAAMYYKSATSKYYLTVNYWNSAGTAYYGTLSAGTWSTASAELNLGSTCPVVEITLARSGTSWIISAYNVTTDTILGTMAPCTPKDTGDPYYNVQGDYLDNYYLSKHAYTLFQYVNEVLSDVTGTRETAKRNRDHSDTRALDYEVTTNDGGINTYGYDQSAGEQVGIKVVPTFTGDMQSVEVLCRQHGTTAIVSNDIAFEVQTDSSGVPSGTVIGRGIVSSVGIDKSTGAYGWLPVIFPSTVSVSASTAYWLVPQVNAAGSASIGIDFAYQTVGSGGTVATRTKSTTWGAWSASSTQKGCVRVYSGWFPVVSRKVSLVTHDGTAIASVDNTPSWESDYTYDSVTSNVEAVYVTDLWYDTSVNEWRGLYCAYVPPSNSAVKYYSSIGSISGPTLTSLTKTNQTPILPNDATGFDEHEDQAWTPQVYDKTPGAMRGYVRSKHDSGPTVQRRLFHISNAHATWNRPYADGGWHIDGVVAYSFPEPANVISPKGWIDGGTTYVQIAVQVSEATSGVRVLMCEQETETSLVNAIPVYVDLSDIGSSVGILASAALSGATQTSDGVWHCTQTKQTATSHANGTYMFDVWVCDSPDRILYASPYPLLTRNAALATEVMGPEAGGGAGIVSDTELVYGGIIRYAPASDPKVQAGTNLAIISLDIDIRGRGRLLNANVNEAMGAFA